MIIETKTIDLAEEVAEKARDTLAGLVAAQFCANDETERNAARQALRVRESQSRASSRTADENSSKLFPRAINPATVLQRLRQLVQSH